MQTTQQSSASLGRLDMEDIARDHYAAVYRFCARRVGVDRAPDAAQDTFVTAQKVLHKYRGESSLSTWLFGIANNECRRIMRKDRIEPCSLEIDVPQQQGGERSLVDRHALREAMSQLSLEHREAVWLHEFEGLTYEEAAVVLGVPVGTVKSRLHHAFVNLRRALFPTEVQA